MFENMNLEIQNSDLKRRALEFYWSNLMTKAYFGFLTHLVGH